MRHRREPGICRKETGRKGKDIEERREMVRRERNQAGAKDTRMRGNSRVKRRRWRGVKRAKQVCGGGGGHLGGDQTIDKKADIWGGGKTGKGNDAGKSRARSGKKITRHGQRETSINVHNINLVCSIFSPLFQVVCLGLRMYTYIKSGTSSTPCRHRHTLLVSQMLSKIDGSLML